MSLCRWADGYPNIASVGRWGVSGKLTQENKRVSEKRPEVGLLGLRDLQANLPTGHLGVSTWPASLRDPSSLSEQSKQD